MEFPDFLAGYVRIQAVSYTHLLFLYRAHGDNGDPPGADERDGHRSTADL